MGFYDDKKNVEDYIKMAKGYDGKVLIDVLKIYLPEKSTVLELGMGPGVDLDMLRETYTVTGSDVSQVFIDRYREQNPDADLMQLDATDLAAERTFDAIYSNKVLHHLTRKELAESFRKQHALLNDNGLLMHSFWVGDTDEEMHGLHFAYYTEQELMEIAGAHYTLLAIERYTEMHEHDSLYLLARKK